MANGIINSSQKIVPVVLGQITGRDNVFDISAYSNSPILQVVISLGGYNYCQNDVRLQYMYYSGASLYMNFNNTDFTGATVTAYILQ